MASAGTKLQVLRNILRELRYLSGYKENLQLQTRNLYGYKYLLEKYRINRTVNEKLARVLASNAETYLCLLKSIREKENIHNKFKGEGERPVEEVAEIVGFKMPTLYRDPEKK